ncbi:MBL fold metallo-hydrolase [Paenibacillus agilis]|nr:MBL fold metallo-hydrolase [Paenibacillus agilis]
MAKLQLLNAGGSSYYLSGKWSVGVYLNRTNNSAVLIDSGPNAAFAKALDQMITNQGYSVGAIVNTHGHAQQCGGNEYFQDRYPNIRIYSSELAAPFVQYPWLERQCAAGEAILLDEHEAGKRTVTDIFSYEDGPVDINGNAFMIVTLPGHCTGMIGIITPDNVMYCSDALFGHQTLERQKLLYFNDIKSTRATFNKLRKYDVSAFVLNHGGIYTDVSPLIEEHIERLEQGLQHIEELVREKPKTYEQIVSEVQLYYEIEDNHVAYAAVCAIVRTLLTELKRLRRIDCYVETGLLFIKGSQANESVARTAKS